MGQTVIGGFLKAVLAFLTWAVQLINTILGWADSQIEGVFHDFGSHIWWKQAALFVIILIIAFIIFRLIRKFRDVIIGFLKDVLAVIMAVIGIAGVYVLVGALALALRWAFVHVPDNLWGLIH